MEIYKWIAGVVVGAFLAGASVVIFLDELIESKINEAVKPLKIKDAEQDKDIAVAGSELSRIKWELPKHVEAKNSANAEKILELGEHQVCFLSKVHSHIFNGTSLCKLTSDGSQWTLTALGSTPIQYDGTKRGNASCEAICGSAEK